MKDNGKEAKPGDRGDAKAKAGLGQLKSGYSGKLQAEVSKGYVDAPSGWGGNVKR